MKKGVYFLFVISFIALIAGCKKEYSQNEEFILKFHKTAIVKINGEELEIKFEEIVNDSRCPPAANCFAPGYVAINIKVNNSDILTLGQINPTPPTITYGNHTITLINVNYNKDKNFGKKRHSSITLRVD